MARLFNDADAEYLEIDSTPITGPPFTMACWYRTDDLTTLQALMWIGDKDVALHYYVLAMYGTLGGDPVGFVSIGTGLAQVASTTGSTVNTWHHACGIEAATNDHRVYIDGGSKATVAGANTVNGEDRISIGRRGDATPDAYMSGRVADAGIWNVALTDEEVAALAGGVSPTRIRPGSLVAYWPLYGVGSPEPDYRGTYDLTLFSSDSGPVPADHAPVQPPFGFSLGRVGVTAVPPVVRIPRHPAAYNTLAIY